MNCTTLTTITKNCDNNIGGLRKMWLFDMESISSISKDSATHLITDITLDNASDIIEYEFKRNVANYNEDVANDFSTGATTVTATINVMFNRREAQKSLSLKVMGEGQRYLGAILLDENNQYWYIQDCRVSTIGDGSGTARTDGSKYAVVLTAEYDELAYGIDATDAVGFTTNGVFPAN